jgi:hypothetical protein
VFALHSSIIYKLLPRGLAFRQDAPILAAFVGAIASEFDRVSAKAEAIMSEIPGHLVEKLDAWGKTLGLVDSTQEAVISRLSATGGQSKAYLESVVGKFNPRAYIRAEKGVFILNVFGADIQARTMRCGSKIGLHLRTYVRNEDLVDAVESIKHAETEAFYYNEEH